MKQGKRKKKMETKMREARSGKWEAPRGERRGVRGGNTKSQEER
jgi:hypothetical protein